MTINNSHIFTLKMQYIEHQRVVTARDSLMFLLGLYYFNVCWRAGISVLEMQNFSERSQFLVSLMQATTLLQFFQFLRLVCQGLVCQDGNSLLRIYSKCTEIVLSY